MFKREEKTNKQKLKIASGTPETDKFPRSPSCHSKVGKLQRRLSDWKSFSEHPDQTSCLEDPIPAKLPGRGLDQQILGRDGHSPAC